MSDIQQSSGRAVATMVLIMAAWYLGGKTAVQSEPGKKMPLKKRLKIAAAIVKG